jgi:hypothetical protein
VCCLLVLDSVVLANGGEVTFSSATYQAVAIYEIMWVRTPIGGLCRSTAALTAIIESHYRCTTAALTARDILQHIRTCSGQSLQY